LQPVIDTTRPHSARVYDYYLGGKDHFAADRETGELAMRSGPGGPPAVRENRAFLGRAVSYLVREAGIRQFLDIGTGLPSADNVHEVAQAVVPECRVVYVDNDPIVLAHARALLVGTPQGRTEYIDADLREPEKILASAAVGETLDLSRPVALMLVAILHFLIDADDPARIVATLLGALPAGSYLVASHVTPEHDPEGVGGLERAYRQGGIPAQSRTSADFAALAFAGLQLIDPGVVLVSEWRRPHDDPRPLPSDVNWYGGIGYKAGR
jgi:SAM-dependent methyltransferase